MVVYTAFLLLFCQNLCWIKLFRAILQNIVNVSYHFIIYKDLWLERYT